MRPSCPSSISTARSAIRASISTTRPSPCSPMRAATARSAKAARLAAPGRGAAHDARAVLCPSRSAVSSRIATASACRNARTRTCTCSKQRSRGSRSTTIRLGAGMADGIAVLCLETIHRSGDRRACASSSPPIGRRRRASRARICEPGHHYEWAFLLDRWARLTQPNEARCGGAADRIRRFCADSMRAAAWRSTPCLPTAASTTRWRGCGRRPNGFAPISRTAAPTTRLPPPSKALRRFLATPTQGVWFDQLTADDVFVCEPARATSLYHIVGAVAELSDAAPDASKRQLACRAACADRRLASSIS